MSLLVFWILYGVIIDTFFHRAFKNHSFLQRMKSLIITVIHGPVGPAIYLYRDLRKKYQQLEILENSIDEEDLVDLDEILTPEQKQQITDILEERKKDQHG